MPLKDIFQKALDELEWEDDIDHDDSEDTDYINTGFIIDGQNYRLTLVTDEKRQHVSIRMKSPIAIPKARRKDGALVLNALNVGLALGNLEAPENGSIIYRWTIDVEGTVAATAQFKTLIAAASAAFDELRVAMIGKVAFTKQLGEDIVQEYWDTVSQMSSKDSEDDSAPSEL